MEHCYLKNLIGHSRYARLAVNPCFHLQIMKKLHNVLDDELRLNLGSDLSLFYQ